MCTQRARPIAESPTDPAAAVDARAEAPHPSLMRADTWGRFGGGAHARRARPGRRNFPTLGRKTSSPKYSISLTRRS